MIASGGDGLWGRAVAATAHARSAGALRPIATECEYIEEAGVCFAVRRVVDDAPDGKGASTPDARARSDPFLPYDPDLYVADLGADHVALLNKFAVFEHHLLVVTRAYEDQQRWLTGSDFRALWQCMAAIDAFGFYNGGRLAGASQAHKHLQVVPLPLSGRGTAVPLEPLMRRAVFSAGTGVVPALRYEHAVARIPREWWEAPDEGARSALGVYYALLRAVGLSAGNGRADGLRSAPYNLLVTRGWMMLVPRRREAWHGISINGLGLAGAILVKDRPRLDLLKRNGPLEALRHVTVPPSR